MFRLKAFGGLCVAGPDGPLTGSGAQRRSLALLVLVAAARDRGISRDKLLGLLWPESGEERARHTLAQMLYRVRQDLGATAIDGSVSLRLNPELVTFDVAEFEDALERDQLEHAVGLYAGPFLDGFYLHATPGFERWMEEERFRLAQRYRDALERLATAAAQHGEHARAVDWWRALAAADPLNTRVAVRLVEALAAAGDRGGALQHARVHEALIRSELATDPDPTLTATVERLKETPIATTALATPPSHAALINLRSAPFGLPSPNDAASPLAADRRSAPWRLLSVTAAHRLTEASQLRVTRMARGRFYALAAGSLALLAVIAIATLAFCTAGR